MRFLESRRRLVGIFLAVSVLPLVLLAYFAIDNSSRALDRRLKGSLQTSATLSALYISEQLRGLAEVDASFAGRPSLVRALAGGDPKRYNRRFMRLTLEQLSRVRPGIGTAFVADSGGKLIDIVPSTPSIVGKDFSFRDWWKGVSRTGKPYVSEAYVSLATGHPHVVAVAAPIWSEGGRRRTRLGILVAAYKLSTVQAFTQRFGRTEGLSLEVTDQRGVLLAGSGVKGGRLLSRRSDPAVAAALAGRAGVSEPNGVVSAFAPVLSLGWTIKVSVPASRAFTEIRALRWRVVLFSLLLGLVLLTVAWVLARALRQRRRAEEETAEALREVRREATINRAILDATDEGILLVDREGNPLVANAALDRIRTEAFGIPNRGNVFDTSEVARRLNDPAGYEAVIAAIAEDPDATATEEIQLADSGRSFEFWTSSVRDTAGSRIGRIFTARETTEARKADQLKSELVSTVSHELRTPLTGILGFAELLTNPKVDEETRSRYVEMILNEARRLSHLIDDFLDLQRIEAGRFALNLEPFELGECLQQQGALYSGQSGAHAIELSLPDERIELVGERDRICQVVGNLLSNAIKYSPQGGAVELTAERRDGVVRVAITDPGLGIPADQQGNVFAKFFRADSSDTRRIGGTGLGLALCKEIVEAHGGRIGFESVEGDGSTFWFELPATSNGSRRTDGSGRILVIEDEPDAATLLELYLKGYEVEHAGSGEEALARAIESPPALICLDIGLRGLDGWRVLAGLKAHPATENVPVILCTANPDRERAAALGATDVLTKPFSKEVLRETISRVLPSGRGSVLVVDDEESVRRLVVQTLVADGLELREAADGEEALAALAERKSDALVLDLSMPRLDGFGVLERLKEDEELRDLPVVVLTAKTLTPDERRRLHLRAVSLLEKTDYSAQQLRRLVGQALGH